MMMPVRSTPGRGCCCGATATKLLWLCAASLLLAVAVARPGLVDHHDGMYTEDRGGSYYAGDIQQLKTGAI